MTVILTVKVTTRTLIQNLQTKDNLDTTNTTQILNQTLQILQTQIQV